MRSRLLLAICTAAGLAACTTDQISAPPATKDPPIAPVAQQSLIGTIVLMDGDLWLKQESRNFLLGGPDVAILRSLVESEVELRGTHDGPYAFIVNTFEVRMVEGLPAADGVLVSMLDGYGLRRADQSVRVIVDPPDELLKHLGERVWIAGPADERPVKFGVIAAAPIRRSCNDAKRRQSTDWRRLGVSC